MQCRIKLCPSCVILQHQSHKPLLINDALKELKNEVLNILNVQQREILIQNKFNHFKQEINNYEKEIELLKKKLENSMYELENSKNNFKECGLELDSLKTYEKKKTNL